MPADAVTTEVLGDLAGLLREAQLGLIAADPGVERFAELVSRIEAGLGRYNTLASAAGERPDLTRVIVVLNHTRCTNVMAESSVDSITTDDAAVQERVRSICGDDRFGASMCVGVITLPAD